MRENPPIDPQRGQDFHAVTDIVFVLVTMASFGLLVLIGKAVDKL
jgi:hypothetical protein